MRRRLALGLSALPQASAKLVGYLIFVQQQSEPSAWERVLNWQTSRQRVSPARQTQKPRLLANVCTARVRRALSLSNNDKPPRCRTKCELFRHDCLIANPKPKHTPMRRCEKAQAPSHRACVSQRERFFDRRREFGFVQRAECQSLGKKRGTRRDWRSENRLRAAADQRLGASRLYHQTRLLES